MEATKVHDTGYLTITAGAAQDPGDVVILGDGRCAVVSASHAIALGDKVVVLTAGVFNVASESATTFADGVAVYWDQSTGYAIAGPRSTSDMFYLGRCVKAKIATQLSVWVDINVQNTESYGYGY